MLAIEDIQIKDQDSVGGASAVLKQKLAALLAKSDLAATTYMNNLQVIFSESTFTQKVFKDALNAAASQRLQLAACEFLTRILSKAPSAVYTQLGGSLFKTVREFTAVTKVSQR